MKKKVEPKIMAKKKEKQTRIDVKTTKKQLGVAAVQAMFDTENLAGVPDLVRKNILGASVRGSGQSNILFDLFEFKSPLTIDEIVIGMWNVYELQKDREWVCSTVSQLRTKGFVKNVAGKSGVYELVKE